MKAFKCPNCSATLYFENSECGNCQKSVGFDVNKLDFSLVGNVDSSSNANSNTVDYCKNNTISVCNWVVEADNTLCPSCELTQKIPTAGDQENLKKWQKLEAAKRRLIYQLTLLNLIPSPENQVYSEEVIFNFLTKDNPEGLKTGHSNGVITILLEEADSVEREQLRKQMSEPYRTLIGHFRHEIGHYYYPILVTGSLKDEYKKLFGDDSQDYGQALEEHYKNGAPQNWQQSYISTYATSHPWEDWAETWAHYLHLMDTLETAHFAGIGLSVEGDHGLEQCPNPYTMNDFQEIFDWSVALTTAGNSLNRSMGIPDIYPFVVPKPVYDKLHFIHRLLYSDA